VGGRGERQPPAAAGRNELRHEIRDHILAAWTNALARDPMQSQPPLSVREGTDLMFYWDSYFTNVGLLRRPELRPLAKANVDFLLQQVRRHGFVPNVNRAWGLNRSQPPYLAVMVRDVWEAGAAVDVAWLSGAYTTLRQEYRFWTTDEVERHTTSIPGLLRYSHHASPDERIEFHDQVLSPRLRLPRTAGRNTKGVLAGRFLAEAESGMDFTPRFEGRCDEFIPVDLNVNLVLYEETFAWMVDLLGLQGEPDWSALARGRWQLVRETCWSRERGLFMDWDFTRGRHAKVASAMAFHPLWAGLASADEAAATVAALRLLEHRGGVAACEAVDPPSGRQWGEEAVWAPLQYLVVAGLDRYGYHAEAARVASRFVDTVTRNWLDPEPAAVWERGALRRHRAPGKLYEKYTIDGRVNDEEYAAEEGFGWTAGVYLYACDYLGGSPSSRVH